jgi:methyl-accepting chemotaxis protein
MKNSPILAKNEIEANRLVAKLMLATVAFVILVLVLDILNIFIADLKTMFIAMSAATIFLALPSVLVFVLKLEGGALKYVSVTSAALVVASLTMFLSWHVVLMYIYPIAMSSLFFSRKLNWYAVIVSVTAVTISQIVGFYLGGVGDLNLKTLYEVVLYGVGPRTIELVVLSLIFILLGKRTKKMLENAVGAEEQKSMLDRMLAMTDKSMEVSEVLENTVRQLSYITEQTTSANEQIAEKTGTIASGSENMQKLVDDAAEAVINISDTFGVIANEGKEISDISEQVGRMNDENGIVIKKAIDKMVAIDKVTGESKDIITKLGERSKEIDKIVEIISGIAGQTNLLALNAAIESARAGEQGKGFAVVAGEIRSLAEQSEKAAKDISHLIKVIVDDTAKAVDAMDKNTGTVAEGLGAINEAGASFKELSIASREMNGKVQQVSRATSEAAISSNRIVGLVKNIRDINHASMEELQNIAAASEEQLASMQQVSSSVDSIEKISSELVEVINRNSSRG